MAPELCISTTDGLAFSHTSSIDRLVEKPWWRMSAGIEAMSPAFMITLARGRPVTLSSISQLIWSEICRNHSTRSFPCLIGRMYSSVVGQNRLVLTTELIDGFQVCL